MGNQEERPKMVETVEQIQEQMKALRAKRAALQNEEFRENILPKLRTMVGETLAYRRNSYSCPEKPSDYWDVFRIVLRVIEKDGWAWLVCQECSIDRDQKPSLSIESFMVCDGRQDYLGSWQPCSRKEFETNYQRTMAAIASPDGYVAHLLA